MKGLDLTESSDPKTGQGESSCSTTNLLKESMDLPTKLQASAAMPYQLSERPSAMGGAGGAAPVVRCCCCCKCCGGDQVRDGTGENGTDTNDET